MPKRRKKKRTHKVEDEIELDPSRRAPKSFVMKKGKVGRPVADLVVDVRRVMEPNTARRLKETKRNTMKDFLSVAGPLGVTHFLIFNSTDVGINMRVARVPRGPTLTFRIQSYALAADVLSHQKKPHHPSSEDFMAAPLVVLNNFTSTEDHVRLQAVMFQNMFPALAVNTMRLGEAKRVVLFNRNAENDTVDVRHYSIAVRAAGLSKSVKRIIQAKIPDVGNYGDIADYILANTDGAESDAEEEEVPMTNMAKRQRNKRTARSTADQHAVRLYEVGPRLTLDLLKTEEGFCGGRVLFNKHITLTPEEIVALERTVLAKKETKARRKAEQAANVERKQEAKERKKKGKGAADGESDSESSSTGDAEYFRREVGEEPESELFSRRKHSSGGRSSGAEKWRNKRRRDKKSNKEGVSDGNSRGGRGGRGGRGRGGGSSKGGGRGRGGARMSVMDRYNKSKGGDSRGTKRKRGGGGGDDGGRRAKRRRK